MKRSTVVRLFLGSLIALASGLVLLGVSTWIALAQDVLVLDGGDVVGVRDGGWTVTVVTIGVLAALVTLAATIGLLVAWIGAVLATAELEDKGWFIALLVVGLLGFAFIATLVYVVAGPPDPAPRPEAAPTAMSRPVDVPDAGAGHPVPRG